MKYLLTITIALFAIGAMAQGRNEYEKRFVEVHVFPTFDCMVISDNSPKNKRDKLLYPDGTKINSLAGLFGFMESLGFKLHESVSTGFGMYGASRLIPVLLFVHKDGEKFIITNGKIMMIQQKESD